MAQHIGIRIQKEKHTEEELDYNFAEIFNLTNRESSCKYIQTIDPYSDTIFLEEDIKYLLLDLSILNDKYHFHGYEYLTQELRCSKKVIFIGD